MNDVDMLARIRAALEVLERRPRVEFSGFVEPDSVLTLVDRVTGQLRVVLHPVHRDRVVSAIEAGELDMELEDAVPRSR